MGKLQPTGRKTRWGTPILTDGILNPRTRNLREILDYSFKGPIELNRSKRWPRCTSYAEARKQADDARRTK